MFGPTNIASVFNALDTTQIFREWLVFQHIIGIADNVHPSEHLTILLQLQIIFRLLQPAYESSMTGEFPDSMCGSRLSQTRPLIYFHCTYLSHTSSLYRTIALETRFLFLVHFLLFLIHFGCEFTSEQDLLVVHMLQEHLQECCPR